jgi:hypothetical protein
VGQALVQTKFYTFNQNNSGGRFHYDFFEGIGRYVIVEAIDQDHANQRAQKIGLYFDSSSDCSCCGGRWSEQWGDDEGTPEPTIYDEPVEKFLDGPFGRRRTDDDEKTVFVHLITGQINAY